MRLIMVVGERRRHRYLANVVDQAMDLKGLIVVKENRPGLARSKDEHLAELQERYLRDERDAGVKFFGEPEHPCGNFPVVVLDREELNGPKAWSLLEKVEADVALTYGVPFLREDTLSRMPQRRWNLHLGLCPAYRGNLAGFWPSYMLEPQMTGMTLHELGPKLDEGDIIHQCTAPLVRGDGIHELICRSAKVMYDELPRVFELSEAGRLRAFKIQRSGKMWFRGDWRADHLRVIYDAFGDRIVDAYLDGKLERVEPRPHRQFE
jgi:folate-dependent phosphoribosylglycinamide formyltransferase PurN